MGIIKLPVPWKPPPPSRFTVTNPGNYPSPIPAGFITKTAQIRVRGHHVPTFDKPQFQGCDGFSKPRTAQLAFRKVAKAWQQGFGYPWGSTAYTPVTINHADWATMAASFQWYKGGGRYVKRSAYQWFQGYQLAAYSANIRNLTINTGQPEDADSLAFVAAPDGVYEPIEITSGFFEYTAQSQPPNITQQNTFFPTPNMGGDRYSVPIENTYQFPPLIMDVTPFTRPGKRRVRKPFFVGTPMVWWDSLNTPPTAAYLPEGAWNVDCAPGATNYYRFAYVSCRQNYSGLVLRFSEIIPTQEPGPPFVLPGPTLHNFF